MTALSFDQLVALCDGKFGTFDRACPICGPSRRSPTNRRRKTMRFWHKPSFITYFCARCGLSGYAREDGGEDHHHQHDRPARYAGDDDLDRRIGRGLKLWNESVPLVGTLGFKYFTECRCLHIGLLDLSHALRWHESIRAVVALMTDPMTAKPTGVHRTFLEKDCTKRERKMLGRQGVVRISPDEEVTTALGIAEGVEDALVVLLDGWSPVWAATCAGAISRFPVLTAIESLTIFADADQIGMHAAEICADNWISVGREARVVSSGQ